MLNYEKQLCAEQRHAPLQQVQQGLGMQTDGKVGGKQQPGCREKRRPPFPHRGKGRSGFRPGVDPQDGSPEIYGRGCDKLFPVGSSD